MGSYATWSADILQRYRFLVEAASLSAADAEAAWIGPAEREIEGRLAARFTMPASSNNLTMRDLTIDLAASYMEDPNAPEVAQRLRDRVDKAITDLLAGRRLMMTSSGTVQPSTRGAWSTTQGYTPAFGPDHPHEWQTDPDLLDDKETERD